MLASLTIQDVVLIHSLTLDFSKGFTVFTGETGAGKSILLDALSLGLGARGDVGLLRKGASQAVVTTLFEIEADHFIWEFLEELGLKQEQEGPYFLILRRILNKEGKSRAFINDIPVSMGFLKKIGERLVEIHGQFDRFLESVEHTFLLDAFGDHTSLTKEVQKAFKEWKEAKNILENAQEKNKKEKAEEEILQYYVQELETFSPKSGEEAMLLQERLLLQSQEKIEKTLQGALDVIDPVQGIRIEESLRAALKILEKNISEETKFLITPIIEALERTFSEYQEAYHLLHTAIQTIEKTDTSLEKIEDRLHALRDLARKHHVMPDMLENLLISFQQKLFSLEKFEMHLEALEENIRQKEEVYKQKAIQLSQKRQAVALILQDVVQKEFPDLKLERTQLKIDLFSFPTDAKGLPLEEGSFGLEKAHFLVDTNATGHFGSLKSIASGGELARILLALKVVLVKAQGAQTLIFDEIDTGVSGAVSEAIGKRLQRLGNIVQVLAITHSPQVASCASSHIRIEKTFLPENASPKTEAFYLTSEERTEEIARLLSGEKITHEARAVAGHLMR